jgi:hypothetical protein
VCEGEQLELTCTTNETFKVWNFEPPLINEQGVSIPQEWFYYFYPCEDLGEE